jgi:hypothetical protein
VLTTVVACVGFAAANLSFARDVDDIVDDWWTSTAYRGGTGGSGFDMYDDLPDYFDTHVYKVQVRHGERIDAIKFYWDYKGGTKTTSSEYYGGGGGSQSSFSLSDDEFIRKIEICSSDSDWDEGRVGYIKFWTTDGNKYSYGDTAKNCNTWSYTNKHIVGLWGREGDEIDRLGIIGAPIVNLEVTGIDIDDNSYDTATTSTTYSSSQVLFNDTSTSQSTTVSVEYKDITSFANSYSETSGISEEYGVEAEVSSDYFDLVDVSTTLSYSVTQQDTLTVGETITESEWVTSTSSISVTVPANSIVVAEAVAYYGDEDVDYTMTVENTYTGEEFDVEGTFSGTSTTVWASWSEIGSISDGEIDIYDAYEEEYGSYE